MYVALYGLKGLVISDHPYNADSARIVTVGVMWVNVRILTVNVGAVPAQSSFVQWVS